MSLDVIATTLALVVGVGRALTGLVFMAAPSRPVSAWVGESSTGVRYLARGLGGRDLVIGVGIIWSTLAGVAPAAWLIASVLGDLVDCAGAGMLERSNRPKTLAMAGGFAALGVVATIAVLAA